MCCLKNEVEAYEDLNTRLPKQGARVQTPDGREGTAQNVNVLRESVQVLFTDEKGNREMEEFPASELKFTPRRKKPGCGTGCSGCQGAQEAAPEQTRGGRSADRRRSRRKERAADDAGSEGVAHERSQENASERDPQLRQLETQELSDMMAEGRTTARDTDKQERPRRRRRRIPGGDTERESGQGTDRRSDRVSDSGRRRDNTRRDNTRRDNTRRDNTRQGSIQPDNVQQANTQQDSIKRDTAQTGAPNAGSGT